MLTTPQPYDESVFGRNAKGTIPRRRAEHEHKCDGWGSGSALRSTSSRSRSSWSSDGWRHRARGGWRQQGGNLRRSNRRDAHVDTNVGVVVDMKALIRGIVMNYDRAELWVLLEL